MKKKSTQKLPDIVHMMSQNMTAICRSFSVGGPLLKTSNSDEVTCPKCLKMISKK